MNCYKDTSYRIWQNTSVRLWEKELPGGEKIRRYFFSIFMRETTTAIAGSDYTSAANWAIFLSGFTAIGKCAMEGIDLSYIPAVIVADFGEEIVTGYDGKFEANFLQNTVADLEAIEDLRPKSVDILLVDHVNNMFIYCHNKQILIDRNMKAGEISETRLRLDENARTYDGLYSLLHTLDEVPLT
jgi:hypothetical protein